MSSSNDLGITGVPAPETATTEPRPSTETPRPAMAPAQDSSTQRPPPPTTASDSTVLVSRRHKALSGGARSRSTSAHNSPMSSRDTSPTRPSHRQPGPPVALPRSGLRSRKSSTDVSPSRGNSLAGSSATIPSAAAIQRALSSATTPPLLPASMPDPSRVPRPLKAPSGSNSGETTPNTSHWPISPRIKSPPPTDTRSRSRRNSLRAQSKKPDSGLTPSIVVQSSSPAPVSRVPVQDDEGSAEPDDQRMIMKAPSRSATIGIAPKLETVQESSLPTTPAFESLSVGRTPLTTHSHKSSDEERNDVTSAKVTEDLSASTTKQSDSGAENNDNKGRMYDLRSASAQRPVTLSPRASMSSISSVATVKSRADLSSRNMTVETETVPSIAQPTIGNQDRSASGRAEGSLRLKPSNETIRPKKEKPKTKRKANSINTGTGRSPRISYHHHRPSGPDNWARTGAASSLGSPASYRSYDDRRPLFVDSYPNMEMRRAPSHSSRSTSLLYSYSGTNSNPRKASSKADVFEQQVATAIDEANSSDSDATFIYESNPPDHQPPHRSRQHHHSRTPSMTSIASMVDPRAGMRDNHKNMGKKTSMKFANPYNQNADMGGSEMGEGTIRMGSGRAGGSHHHHIGRHGHGRGALNHILADSDSSLAQSARAARGPSSRYASQPNSPRFQNLNVSNGSGNSRKHGEFSVYDMDMENAADDERTPLITRSPRARTPRQRNSANLRQPERRHRRTNSWCRKVAGCLVLSILVLVLIFSAVGLIFATTKPLSSVKVHAIQNVIASQEELMLDLVVEAINPNIIGVTVADMDMNIFAKSKHVGSDKWWREHGGKHHSNEEEWIPISDDIQIQKGIDEGTDPVADPEVGEPRTMLLGRIFHFDSPLSFDGYFFKRHKVQSLGAMRLSNPGNKTEAGGTERWEEVLQYPFELIVKGVFKYQLPLSTQERKVAVNATYHYDPDAEKKKMISPTFRTKRHLPPQPVKILSEPLGRYARALALVDP